MIISPPFLKPREKGESEDQWIDRTHGVDPQRNYPLNDHHAWHGGLHVLHSDAGSQPEFIRAIADGTVVSLRQSRLENRDKPPLNYVTGKNGTDNGYVLLRHETTTGTGENTTVVFYSLYMHLTQLRPELAKGKKVWRKDKLGTVGMIDGCRNGIHFQIFCDDENIQKLVGRTTVHLDLNTDGRKDVIYGDMHFYLPPGIPIYPDEPDFLAKSPRSTPVPGTHPLYVTRQLKQGDMTVTSRIETTPGSGEFAVQGEPVVTSGLEYSLYAKVKAHGAGQNQSAMYEMLRFGRIISPDQEELTDPDMPVWCQIQHPAGTGWVNLANPQIKKYSDADFPHWMGWQLVDDDTDSDSQCNSPTVLAAKEAGTSLDRLICHFPFEWDRSTQVARYQWLTSPNEHVDPPMTDEDYAEFIAYANALSLDDALPGGRYWHFQPLEFIKHFRKCLWLSKSEFEQLVPVYAIRSDAKHNYWEKITLHDGDDSVFSRHYNGLNRAMRKYGINTPWRMACFLGNALQESNWLNTTTEGYVYTHTDKTTHKKTKYNIWYYPWYGRGFLQLTSPGNYFAYWSFRGRTYSEELGKNLSDAYKKMSREKDNLRYSDSSLLDESNPDLSIKIIAWRDDVANHHYDPSDSAGYYWLNSSMDNYSDQEHELQRCNVNTLANGQKCYYRSKSFWQASAAVNYPSKINNTHYQGINGFDSRCSAYSHLLGFLTEIKFEDANGVPDLFFPDNYPFRRAL
ncbi:M23 family peptidase [Enterobacter ludwigii]|uniref:M23 family peptidase n=1 Tax=Enterobacter ludwigii TaxID=299767 RepID=UPI003BEF4B64